MVSSEPAKSCGIVLPRAVEGFWARFVPTAPAKCTSPPKPMVTECPLPFQSGLSGECVGKCSAATVACWVVEVEVEVEVEVGDLPEPPEKKAR